MSFEGFKSPESNKNHDVIMTAFDPGTGRTSSMRGYGDSMDSANAALIQKGWITNLAVYDGGGSAQASSRATGYGAENVAADQAGSKKNNFAQGPDNRAVPGSESGSKKDEFRKGTENRAVDGSESGAMPRKGVGIGPDNRAVDGTATNMPKKGTEIGANNRAVDDSETSFMKVPGPHNKRVEGSEHGHKDRSGIGSDNRRAEPIKEAIKDFVSGFAKYPLPPFNGTENVLNQLKKI